MSKQELRTQIKLLRAQMYNLEVNCKEREDKLLSLLLTLEPFFNALSPEIHKQIADILNIEDD